VSQIYSSKPLFNLCFRFKELGNQKAYNAAVQFDHNMCDKPIDLLHETIHCQDGPSGHITEYTVVDCGTSVVSGDYFVLQDVQGGEEACFS
jgi:hypothetical protein